MSNFIELLNTKRPRKFYKKFKDGIDYYISPVSDVDVQSWKTTNHDSLHLPRPNPFIPRSLDLCPELPPEARTQRIDKPTDPPKLVENDSNIGESYSFNSFFRE